MPFQKGQSGNPLGARITKPFRDALRIEEALAADGQETPAKPGTLRFIARQMLIRAGEETADAKEVADRLDGKVAQAIVGDDEADPIRLQVIERRIVKPDDTDS